MMRPQAPRPNNENIDHRKGAVQIPTASRFLLLSLICVFVPSCWGRLLRGSDDGSVDWGGSMSTTEPPQNVMLGSSFSDATPIGIVPHPNGNFTTLTCNENLDEQPCTSSSDGNSWSSFFGSATTFTEEIVIPCGQCIFMDHATTTSSMGGQFKKTILVLKQGLDIQGKLVIIPEDGHSIHIQTPHIFVQGELHMNSSKPIDGRPNIHITITSASEGKEVDNDFKNVLFLPARDNELVCQQRQPRHSHEPKKGVSKCDVGQKPIIVAGGKLVIQGLPSQDMPTWVPLHDVATSTVGWTLPAYAYQSYRAPPTPSAVDEEAMGHNQTLNCPLEGLYINHSFSGPTSENDNTFSGSLGAHWEIKPGALHIYHRTSTFHGVAIDLKDIRDCLDDRRHYLVTFRIRIIKPDFDGTNAFMGTLSECGRSNEHCLLLVSETLMENSITATSQVKWTELKSHQSKYGEILTVATDLHFDKIELEKRNIYHHLIIQGAATGIDLELLDFTMRLPPLAAYPDPDHVCSNLVPGNGNAELVGLHPYPFTTNNPYTHVVVAEEESHDGKGGGIINHYFQVTGRSFSYLHVDGDEDWQDSGLSWDIPSGCIKAGSQYRIHANVRIHPNQHFSDKVSIEISIQGHVRGDHPDIFEVLVACPRSIGEWVSCDGVFVVPARLVDVRVRKYEVFFETVETFNVNYDVDNLSFELIEGPLDRLVVSNTVRNLWLPGAELLITSHTNDWNGHQIAKIAHVEKEDIEPGMLEIKLVGSIRRPTTVKDNEHYATEVALLSRNILVEGEVTHGDKHHHEGGHLVILHTPDVPQIIEGAEFRHFGQAGIRDRYPIHFDHCGDSGGSVVSKNTIRTSDQRCVVIHASNHILVANNVAFATKGHCFVLESGTEVGNFFVQNLGASTIQAEKIMPQYGVSGKETDDQPATFWTASPSNHWEGNVAAGSQGCGFWLQLGNEPRGPHSATFMEAFENSNNDGGSWNPSTMTLALFENNVGHSNSEFGFKAQDFFPTEKATLHGFRSYLNGYDGLDVKEAGNLVMVDSIMDVSWQPSPRLSSRGLRSSSRGGASLDDIELGNLSIVPYPQGRTSHAIHNATQAGQSVNEKKEVDDFGSLSSLSVSQEQTTPFQDSVPSYASVFNLQQSRTFEVA